MARIDEIKKKAKLSMDEMYSSTSESKSVHNAVSTAKQPEKEMCNKKMTLYLSERLFKAFNNIYAKRMLEDRKTDKSELICEAIELLIQKENK